ncbi:uncharacterized protein PV07_06212 [Cladophialophora immunda]|uniref:VOC domain-containing protein n=1 Tax=Cladophialophora immunda TaxID=569365 RepID=A0A0D2CK78_9EURO|nr:uncharacterized protein PV07_06212 [Cladophialophora immunda]KIW30470.1 hypothetical protein PV07_06212 [Cladophialophora immunda]OQU97052.1 hypothetical protein CLAIMM_03055 [Cladophialophora immunda]
MSRLFGTYRQNGYIVDDLEKAIEYWTEKMGVGPFFLLPSIALGEFSYRGSTVKPVLDIALANFGDVQIELIQPKDDTPSPYRDFLRSKGPGLHHISVWSDNFDDHLRRLGDLGLRPDCTGQIEGGPRFCYFDAAETRGTTIEIADSALETGLRDIAAKIHAASVGWDGSDPVRDASQLK